MKRPAQQKRGRRKKGKLPTRAGPVSAAARASCRADTDATNPERKGSIRPSKAAPKRAAVLIAIQVAMIVHVVVWWLSLEHGWWDGYTIKPLEPSEAAETAATGEINPGFLLFGSAIFSTAILGRWFCGWACHVVMLQDFCLWLLGKVGIKPKPFRTRFLPLGTLALALYVFVWPLVKRVAAPLLTPMGFAPEAGPWTPHLHLVDSDFWGTFPGVALAIPFLFICGFVTVYFLGAKGFCTYACPYGGFFAAVDRLSPLRIRVTSACEGCGHCTAVCTSNVRVHDEVRAHRMVVDPGCMKCLDCVSVCPNDALYFGVGKPAFAAGKPHGKPVQRKYDLTFPEEIAVAVLLVLAFLAWVQAYGFIPLLMAGGIAICVAWLGLQLRRLVKRPNVSMQRTRLKASGRLTTAGWAFVAFAAASMLITAHAGAMRVIDRGLDAEFTGLQAPFEELMRPARPAVPADRVRQIDAAIAAWTTMRTLGRGGINLFTDPNAEAELGRLNSAKHDFGKAAEHMRVAVSADDSQARYRDLAFTLRMGAADAEADRTYTEGLAKHPRYHALRGDYMLWLGTRQQFADVVSQGKAAIAADPAAAPKLTKAWRQLLAQQRIEEAETLLDAVLERAPGDLDALTDRAVVHMMKRQFDDARVLIQRVLPHRPKDSRLHAMAADAFHQLGRHDEARMHGEMVRKLPPPKR